MILPARETFTHSSGHPTHISLLAERDIKVNTSNHLVGQSSDGFRVVRWIHTDDVETGAAGLLLRLAARMKTHYLVMSKCRIQHMGLFDCPLGGVP